MADDAEPQPTIEGTLDHLAFPVTIDGVVETASTAWHRFARTGSPAWATVRDAIVGSVDVDGGVDACVEGYLVERTGVEPTPAGVAPADWPTDLPFVSGGVVSPAPAYENHTLASATYELGPEELKARFVEGARQAHWDVVFEDVDFVGSIVVLERDGQAVTARVTEHAGRTVLATRRARRLAMAVFRALARRDPHAAGAAVRRNAAAVKAGKGPVLDMKRPGVVTKLGAAARGFLVEAAVHLATLGVEPDPLVEDLAFMITEKVGDWDRHIDALLVALPAARREALLRRLFVYGRVEPFRYVQRAPTEAVLGDVRAILAKEGRGNDGHCRFLAYHFATLRAAGVPLLIEAARAKPGNACEPFVVALGTIGTPAAEPLFALLEANKQPSARFALAALTRVPPSALADGIARLAAGKKPSRTAAEQLVAALPPSEERDRLASVVSGRSARP